MENLTIIEYSHSYAAKVADMWRKSIDGWTGRDMQFLTTEQEVIEDDKNADYINKYLAKLGDEIVGYCKLEKYSEKRVGISLLNTRFDLHGKGIGKKLVMRSIERAMDLGYDEIHLYTWPGNTKSIPLYKKCGFMYEKDHKQTFLRNFIPGIISLEIFKDFFKTVDWYKGLKRKIDLEWDDINKDGMTYYEYLWQENGESLRLNFEKKSRGLCLIETNDYLIRAKVENQSLICGQSYHIYYEIINKTGKPLKIQLKGESDRNIKYNAAKSVDVVDRLTIKEEFTVDKSEDMINKEEALPSVKTNMIINDKEVSFKIGIDSKEAVTLSMNREKEEGYLNKIEHLYLDIENNIDEEVEYTLELSDKDNIKIINKVIDVKINGLGKKSIKVEYILKKFMIYDEPIKVKGKLKDGSELNFESKCAIALRGRGGRFGGQVGKGYIIANDKYLVSVKEEFFISFKDFSRRSELALGLVPTLGEPWSMEFYDKNPNKVQWSTEEDNIVMKMTFDSNDFKGIELTNIFKLSPLGVLERYCEVKNISYDGTLKDLKLKHEIFVGTAEGVIPYRNKFINLNGTKNLTIANINTSELTENWMYLHTSGESLLLYWNKDIEVSDDGILLELIQPLSDISDDEEAISKSIYMCFNTFDNWRQAREYVVQDYKSNELIEEEIIDIKVNESNPFVDKDFTIKFKENLKNHICGDYFVKSQNRDFDIQVKNLTEDNMEQESILKINTEGRKNMDILDINFTRENTSFNDKKLIFIKGKEQCKGEVFKEDGYEIYQVNNGGLNIRLSPDFAPYLYSLIYNNEEMLDSSFPTPGPKGQYNPWFGGLGVTFKGLNSKEVKDQLIEGGIVTLKDNFNNEWMGVKSSLIIKEHETLKGVTLNEYYMMLPNVPVLAHLFEVEQKTGGFMKNATVNFGAFFKFHGQPEENYLMCKNSNGKLEVKRANASDETIRCGSLSVFSTDKVNCYIHSYMGDKAVTNSATIGKEGFSLRSFREINIPNGEKVFIGPKFYILSDKLISEDLLKQLNKIYMQL